MFIAPSPLVTALEAATQEKQLGANSGLHFLLPQTLGVAMVRFNQTFVYDVGIKPLSVVCCSTSQTPEATSATMLKP